MTNRFIKETARAWNIPQKQVKRITWWIDENVPKERQSIVFAVLLRRKRRGQNHA